MKNSDVDECTRIWTERMASGYSDARLLANVANNVDGYSGVVAERQGNVVGFAAGHIGLFAEVISVPYSTVSMCGLGASQTVGNIAIVAVSQGYEGQGIGSKLSKRIMHSLTQHEVPVVAQVWRRSGVDGGDVIERLGLEPCVTLSDYWEYMTTDYGECPECGMSPCGCEGTLFIQQT